VTRFFFDPTSASGQTRKSLSVGRNFRPAPRTDVAQDAPDRANKTTRRRDSPSLVSTAAVAVRLIALHPMEVPMGYTYAIDTKAMFKDRFEQFVTLGVPRSEVQ
jgi:hypothetical protein